MNSYRSYVVNAIIEWILDNDCTPYLVLDTTIDGVEVPNEGIKNNQITLNVAPRAVNHFELTTERLSFDTRFHGISRRISSPVGAIIGVYAKENQQGLFFPAEGSEVSESGAKTPQKGDVGSSNTIEFKVPK